MDRLSYILNEEGLESNENAISVIARASDGSTRDALSLLRSGDCIYKGASLMKGR